MVSHDDKALSKMCLMGVRVGLFQTEEDKQRKLLSVSTQRIFELESFLMRLQKISDDSFLIHLRFLFLILTISKNSHFRHSGSFIGLYWCLHSCDPLS